MENMQDRSLQAELQTPKSPGLFVLLGGLITTAVALAVVSAVSFASDGEFNLMGIYVWFIIPASAVGVGVVAASGYSLVSWLRGIRIGKGLFFVVLGLMVLAYFTAQYVEYRAISPAWEDGTKARFWEYFDAVTRSFTFERRGSSGEPEALGGWGYGVRALEVAGFSLGGLVPLLILAGKPYCRTCRIYMRTRLLCGIPAAPPKRKAPRKDNQAQEALQAEHATVAEQAEQTLQQIAELVAQKDLPGFSARVEALQADAKDTAKRHRRIVLYLTHCPRCFTGRVQPKAVTGHGDKKAEQDLPPIPADAEFLRRYLGG